MQFERRLEKIYFFFQENFQYIFFYENYCLMNQLSSWLNHFSQNFISLILVCFTILFDEYLMNFGTEPILFNGIEHSFVHLVQNFTSPIDTFWMGYFITKILIYFHHLLNTQFINFLSWWSDNPLASSCKRDFKYISNLWISKSTFSEGFIFHLLNNLIFY